MNKTQKSPHWCLLCSGRRGSKLRLFSMSGAKCCGGRECRTAVGSAGHDLHLSQEGGEPQVQEAE